MGRPSPPVSSVGVLPTATVGKQALEEDVSRSSAGHVVAFGQILTPFPVRHRRPRPGRDGSAHARSRRPLQDHRCGVRTDPTDRKDFLVRWIGPVIGFLIFGGMVALLVVLAVGTMSGPLFGPRPVTAISDYDQVCGGVGAAEAAEYQPGDGRHPVVVFQSHREGEAQIDGSPVFFGGSADAAVWRPDYRAVELVACARRVASAGPVASCDFPQAGSIVMYEATVSISVHVARTGEEIGEPVELVGLSTECP